MYKSWRVSYRGWLKDGHLDSDNAPGDRTEI
jgi:hypothetical protein